MQDLPILTLEFTAQIVVSWPHHATVIDCQSQLGLARRNMWKHEQIVQTQMDYYVAVSGQIGPEQQSSINKEASIELQDLFPPS